MTQSSETNTCPTCGTTRITFDPPLYFEPKETCGKKIEIHITTIHATMAIFEHCVNYKGHENSENPNEHRHYALVEEVFYFDVLD
jgi:hypothetical protein